MSTSVVAYETPSADPAGRAPAAASSLVANGASETPTVLLRFIFRGRNPRTYFDSAEMDELIASVRSQGILQPILVRPVKDGYEIVAGERRFRAALAAYGEDFPMPVTIKAMSDAEVDAAAAVENIQRADMSATEEAVSASKVVGQVKGDRDEAALTLGWSRSKLDKRLALMNCSPAVQKALNERHIMLGHAELLAALAKDKQELFLPVIINEKKSVPELKSSIEKAASRLGDAIFPQEDCNGCPHNSSVQQSMFVESVVDGCCTNNSCYREKTEAALQVKVASLKDDYPVIRILRIGDNSTRVKLIAEGPKGVGTEQAEACRGCASFGAAVSALPQAMAQVYTDQCFDPTCNANKVAARLIAASALASSVETTAVPPTAGGSEGGKAGNTKTAPVAPKTPATSIHVSDRIKAYREQVWRVAMKREIANSPALSNLYLVALCLNGSSRHINSTALGKAFSKLAGKSKPASDLGHCVQDLGQLSAENLGNMTTMLAASAMADLDVHHLQNLAKHHQLDLTKHWKLEQPLLELLTKSEIELIAKEVGLKKAFGDDYKKIMGEKKPDLMKALLNHPAFDYSAKIPSILTL